MSRYDVAEFEAQGHAADMVAVLAGLAMDVTQPASLRRDCANDVLNRAYGTPAQKAAVSTVDPASPEGAKTGDMIEAMKRTSAQLQLLDAWAGKPVETWPAHVRALVDDADAFYGEVAGSAD